MGARPKWAPAERGVCGFAEAGWAFCVMGAERMRKQSGRGAERGVIPECPTGHIRDPDLLRAVLGALGPGSPLRCARDEMERFALVCRPLLPCTGFEGSEIVYDFPEKGRG